MATLTIWRLDSATGADRALGMLKRFQNQNPIQVLDAAVVSWPEGARKPHLRQLHDVVSAGGLGGAFWGFLFAVLFFMPLLGLALAAGIGAVVASTAELGIDDSLIKKLRERITPGTSAVLLLSSNMVTDGVADEMQAHQGHAELIETNLSREQESKLRSTFTAQPAVSASDDAFEDGAGRSSGGQT
jgi:uncharacterized membrane protein